MRQTADTVSLLIKVLTYINITASNYLHLLDHFQVDGAKKEERLEEKM